MTHFIKRVSRLVQIFYLTFPVVYSGSTVVPQLFLEAIGVVDGTNAAILTTQDTLRHDTFITVPNSIVQFLYFIFIHFENGIIQLPIVVASQLRCLPAELTHIL